MGEHNSDQESLRKVHIERVKAQTKKLDLEIIELNSQINRPWYKKTSFLKAFIGALLVIPLFWFYVKEIVLPISETKTIQLNLKLQQKESELIKASLAFEKDIKLMKAEFEKKSSEYISNLENQKKENQKIQRAYEKISQEYDDLSKKTSLTSGLQKMYQEKLVASNETIELLKTQKKKLDKTIQAAKKSKEKTQNLNVQRYRRDWSKYFLQDEDGQLITDEDGQPFTTERGVPLEFVP